MFVPGIQVLAKKLVLDEELVASGRQRAWAKPRAQLAYLARAWCGMKAIEIARHLNRDASMVSRLCASHEAVRDLKTEKKIAEASDRQLTTRA